MRSDQADIAVTVAVAVLAFLTALAKVPTWATAVLGFALFGSCGYLLGQVLFGSRIAGLERVAVCAALTLAIPVLGGLMMYFARIPLFRAAWLGLLVVVTLVCAAVLYVQRRSGRALPFEFPQVAWRGSHWHAVAFGAAVLIAIAALAVAREGVALQHQQTFTELWLTPERHDASVGSLGVTNDQGTTTSYRLVLLRRGKVKHTWNFTLADGKTWQETVSLTDKYVITADLYRLPNLKQPYRYVSTASNPEPQT
jgi:hypothetical protein